MDRELFCKSLVTFAEQFLDKQPYHVDRDNISQYTSLSHVRDVYNRYEMVLAPIRGSVIDVGSGVGFAKNILPSIHTANLPGDFFIQAEKALGVRCDFLCINCKYSSKWIHTPHLYDYVILNRFMPWNDQQLTPEVERNIFTGTYNILKDSGTLLYIPLNIKYFDNKPWKRVNSSILVITKAQIHNELYPAPAD